METCSGILQGGPVGGSFVGFFREVLQWSFGVFHGVLHVAPYGDSFGPSRGSFKGSTKGVFEGGPSWGFLRGVLGGGGGH